MFFWGSLKGPSWFLLRVHCAVGAASSLVLSHQEKMKATDSIMCFDQNNNPPSGSGELNLIRVTSPISAFEYTEVVWWHSWGESLHCQAFTVPRISFGNVWLIPSHPFKSAVGKWPQLQEHLSHSQVGIKGIRGLTVNKLTADLFYFFQHWTGVTKKLPSHKMCQPGRWYSFQLSHVQVIDRMRSWM